MRWWTGRKKWIQVGAAVALILLPVAWWWIHDISTAPRVLRIATGPGRGLYEKIALSIARRIRVEIPGIEVVTVPTEGSLENRRLLEEGVVDFALYQTGTLHFLGGPCAAFRRLDRQTAPIADAPPRPPCSEDGSGDDYLDLEEFSFGRHRESAERAFTRLDTSRDGLLDYEEYTATEAVRAVANIHYEVANVFLRSSFAAGEGAAAPASDDAKAEPPREPVEPAARPANGADPAKSEPPSEPPTAPAEPAPEKPATGDPAKSEPADASESADAAKSEPLSEPPTAPAEPAPEEPANGTGAVKNEPSSSEPSSPVPPEPAAEETSTAPPSASRHEREPEPRVARIAVGAPMSGDRAMSQFLIESLGDPGIEETHQSYPGLRDALERGELDGAIVTAGVRAPILRDLAGIDGLALWDNPVAGALTTANPLLTEYTIEKGLYRIDPPFPARDISTIAIKAQLLTRERASPRLVEIVTRTVLSKEFVQENQLKELFEQHEEFAAKSLEFETHRGAMNVYDPNLHPLLPTDLVESTEGIRSFIFSCVIAGFLAFQWWRRRRETQSEHRLDRYIRLLLEIERRQIDLDADDSRDDLATLQVLLDEVTHLRQEVLREISAHELNDERGPACFIDMTHELSQKINAKIARQRLDRQLGRLVEAIEKSSRPPDPGRGEAQ